MTSNFMYLILFLMLTRTKFDPQLIETKWKKMVQGDYNDGRDDRNYWQLFKSVSGSIICIKEQPIIKLFVVACFTFM